MLYLETHAARVHYRDQGSGATIVCGHSSTGSGGQWRRLAERLDGRYRLLMPDHLGYGRTDPWPRKEPLLEHELAIVNRVVDLAAGPVHLVGHSYGGGVLARWAVRRPERVASLTLAEPTLFYLLEVAGRDGQHLEIKTLADRVVGLAADGEIESSARTFIDYWIGAGAFDALDDRVRRTVMTGIPKLRDEFPTAFADPANPSAGDLAALDCPVLLIAGDHTTAAARGVVEVLREVWPQARHQVIDDAAHMAPVTHAAVFNRVVADFLAA